MAGFLSRLWDRLVEWQVPRFAAEFAVACAAVLIVLRIGGWTIVPRPSQRGVSRVENVADLSSQARAILKTLSIAAPDSLTLDKRIVSALEKLPKTLLLEESRGANDVAIYKKAAPATVLVVTEETLGSGVVVDSSGDVVTNWHVIKGAKRIAVVFKPERGVAIRKELAYAALPVKIDQVADLALLNVNIPSTSVPFLPLANMETVEVGQDVHAIGHPEGEVWTYTTGIISQIRPNYRWAGEDKVQHESKVIQTQTAINPGNSGGPLLNDRGQIIGINSFKSEGEGLNYAVAADVVAQFLKRSENHVTENTPRSVPNAVRMERYGSTIAGLYLQTTAPPPDLWIVYRDLEGREVKYSATGRVEKTKLDTVIAVKGDNSLVFYFDVDCDGMVDLIGYTDPASGTVSRYERPEYPLPLMVSELGQAVATGTIPYRQIHVCQ